MLNSVLSNVGVDSVSGESRHSADRERATKHNAPQPRALDRDCTLADDYDQSTELCAYKKGRASKRGGRVRPQACVASLEQNTEESVTPPTGLTNSRLAEMQPRGRQWRYRMTRARASRIAALGKTSACIVHEINQPVAALMINTQAALRFLDGPNPNIRESQRALTRVLQLGNRIAGIVRHTRALVERVPPKKDDFEINKAIRDIVSLSQQELARNDVSVHTRFAQGLPVVRADQIQVQQVMLNLITNAVQAMSGVSEGMRELRISTGQTTSGDILVTVQDSGPGLGAESSDHLFAAFYSTKPRGLGIGLSICDAIIQAHGGRLWASPSDPHGATFQFTLPQIRSDRMAGALQRRSKSKVKGRAAGES
jgi:C4-dicarboxylate-specific signal transduction histidine kinase